MSWVPSRDPSITDVMVSRFWTAIEPIYDQAVPLAPMPRMQWEELKKNYILDRGLSWPDELASMRSRLPSKLAELPLGKTEIDLIDFLVNYEKDRVMSLEGPRGAGKSSLLHYVEAAIQSSDYEFPPIFILFDGLHLIDGHGEPANNAFAVECPKFVAKEIKERLRKLQQPFNTAFKQALRVLDKKLTPYGVTDAFRTISNNLNDRQRRQIVIVFDNLDHLPSDCVRSALELARAIYTSANIASIICLRPNCLAGADLRGDARHFIQFRMRVPAPRAAAWLAKLGDRLAEAVVRLEGEHPREIIILNRSWNGFTIKDAVDKFTAILMARSQNQREDVVSVLQAVAADDTRHLDLLVRRMLQNDRLPTDYLLGLNSNHEYHPVSALLEGNNPLFRENSLLPNLLYFRKGNDESDFLLSHRILALLSNTQYASLTDLVAWLKLLDYPEEVVYACLHMLHGPLLIRGTDTDMFDPRCPPSGVYITEAGHYYRNHFLKTVDYVLAAVLDVPLEHRALRQTMERDRKQLYDRSFGLGPRIDSLLEYAEEVAIRELNQVNMLASATASKRLRRLADTLRGGGLLLNDLMLVLASALERAKYSNNLRLRREAEEQFAPRVGKLQERLDRLQKRLEELTNKGRKIPRTLRSDADLQRVGDIVVASEDRGDDLHTSASVPLSQADPAAILAINAMVGGMPIMQCTVAVQLSRPEQIGLGRTTSSATGIFPTIRDRAGSALENITANSSPLKSSNGKTVVLAPQRRGSTVQLFLIPCDGEGRHQALGDPVQEDTLKSEARSCLDYVDALSASPQEIFQAIQMRGTKLAQLVMNSSGQNYFSSLLPSVSHCIIFSSEDAVTIPWEWLRPPPRFGDPYVPTLGESCMTSRWTLNPTFAIPKVIQRPERRISTFCTIGLGVARDHPWWYSTPSSLSALSDLCSEFQVLHIVGHFNSAKKVIEVRDQAGSTTLSLSYDSFVAFPFCGRNHSIILSSCAIGRLEREINVALAMAEMSESVVWTPLISITDEQARVVDSMIAEAISGPTKANLASVFRVRKDDKDLGALRSVYIGFGL